MLLLPCKTYFDTAVSEPPKVSMKWGIDPTPHSPWGSIYPRSTAQTSPCLPCGPPPLVAKFLSNMLSHVGVHLRSTPGVIGDSVSEDGITSHDKRFAQLCSVRVVASLRRFYVARASGLEVRTLRMADDLLSAISTGISGTNASFLSALHVCKLSCIFQG